MCVFKYHAFIYFLRPPPWYGTWRHWASDYGCSMTWSLPLSLVPGESYMIPSRKVTSFFTPIQIRVLLHHSYTVAAVKPISQECVERMLFHSELWVFFPRSRWYNLPHPIIVHVNFPKQILRDWKLWKDLHHLNSWPPTVILTCCLNPLGYVISECKFDIYLYVYIYIYVYVYMYTYIYLYTFICIQIYLHIYLYKYGCI